MTPHYVYRDKFRSLFGNDFQRWFSVLAKAMHPNGDYQEIRVTRGDGAIDGFSIDTQTVYQVFAPIRINEMHDSETAAKIRHDFTVVRGHLKTNLKRWIF